MFGRKSQTPNDASQEIGAFMHLDEDEDKDIRAKQKPKAEPSRGFFRKAGQYDELKDDLSDRSSSPTKSAVSDRTDIPCFDRDSSSTVYTQRSAALSARISQGVVESLRTRLAGKDDSSDTLKTTEDVKEHRPPSFKKSAKPSSGSKGKKRAISSAQSKSKAGYNTVATSEYENMDSQEANPPRSTSLESGNEPYSKRSPGLMSSAARFAASFGQVSKTSSSSDRLKQVEDSALETMSNDPDSPAGSHYSQFQPMSEAVGMTTPPPKPSRLGLLSTNSPRQLFGGHVSPGATRPLLAASDGSVSPSPCPSPAKFPSNQQLGVASGNGFHTTIAYKPQRMNGNQKSNSSGRKTDPLPQSRSLSSRDSSRSETGGATAREREMSSSESKVQRARSSDLIPAYSVRRLPVEALDIFEPRPDHEKSSVEENAVKHKPKRTMTQAIKHVENMTGREALKALESGALLKKKWMGSADAREAPAMTKTERLIRCRMQGGKVVVHYHHKGVKGFLDKDEVITQVQRVEVVDGPWREGDCLLLHTGRGVLALSAPDAATYTTWTLGLNAALTSSQPLAGDILLEAPVHAIPRDSMFVVNNSSVN